MVQNAFYAQYYAAAREREEAAPRGDEDAAVESLAPVHDAAVHVRLARPPPRERVEAPDQLAVICAEIALLIWLSTLTTAPKPQPTRPADSRYISSHVMK